MMGARLLVGVLTVLMAVSMSLSTCTKDAAASSTPRHGLGYTDHETMNADLDRIDQRLNLTPTGMPATDLIFCGALGSSAPTFLGPASGGDKTGELGEGGQASAGGANCNAAGSSTEATADEPLYTQFSARVLGMYCKAVTDTGGTGSGTLGVTFTLRSAAANTSPVMTCTVPTGQIECAARASSLATAPIIAPGALADVQAAVGAENLSANDGWCKVFVSVEP